MFVIHYVANRESNQPVFKETSGATRIADAIARGRQVLRDASVAFPHPEPGRPNPIGFLIFDDTGSTLFHREYMD